MMSWACTRPTREARTAERRDAVAHQEDRLPASRAGAARDAVRPGRRCRGQDLTVSAPAGNLRRLLEGIGLDRVLRDITPHPLDYAREFDRRKAEEAAA